MVAVSARDPRVADAVALLRTPGERLCLDGPELLEAALAEGLDVELVLAADPGRWAHVGAEIVAAAPDALRALGALGQAAEVAAIVARPRAGDPAGAALVLRDVRDGGNVGSILRSAAAFGATVALAGGADPFGRRALRAAAGASLRAGLVATVAGLEGLGPLAAAVPRGGVAPGALPPGVVIVLGNEREGLSDDDLAHCEHRVTIPAAGFESLNVAAAAAILLWERAR